MPHQRITEDTKTRIIEAFEQEEDYIEVARLLHVRHIKVDDDMRDCLIDIIERNPAFTLEQINNELQNILPNKPHISLPTVAKILDGQLIRMKKLEDAPSDRNSNATKTSRRDYAQWYMQNAMNANVIFIDECGFNLHTRRMRGRARIGIHSGMHQYGGHCHVIYV
jgi:hypothetical protein